MPSSKSSKIWILASKQPTLLGKIESPKPHSTIGAVRRCGKKYSGLGASELAELKALKEENRRLNRIAEATHVCGISSGSQTGKRDYRKKAVRRAALKPAQRLIVSDISQKTGFSIERACRVLRLSTGVFYYKTVKDDMPVVDVLNELAEEYPTRGFDWYYGNLRNRGLPWNRKRVLRIYRNMDLKLRRKRKGVF